MTPEVFHSMCYKMANAPVRHYPYPHFFIDQLFPANFYQELLSFLPETNYYQKISESGKVPKGSYERRYQLSLSEDGLAGLPLTHAFFWQKMVFFLSDPEFIQLLLNKFRDPIRDRFREQVNCLTYSSVVELIRDHQHYSIGPHTDHPTRVITLLFYFPGDCSRSELGTSIYRPSDPHFTCEGFQHHAFEEFVHLQTMPYLPNSVFGFVKTCDSFHGVEPLQEEAFERNLMNFYIRWEKK